VEPLYSDTLLNGGKIINCPETAKITFTNNTAPRGGTAIYIYGVEIHDVTPVACKYGTVYNSDKDLSAIAGDPAYV
jgi:hypothetical protein